MTDLTVYFPDLRSGMALDVGTRFGEFAYRLAELMPDGSQVIGLDCDAAAVMEARERCRNPAVVFVQGDGTHLDFPDKTFQLTAISNTLHHLPDPAAVLLEMYRVLAPGGYFVVNEMFQGGQNSAQQVHTAQHTFEALLDRLSGGYQEETWTKAKIIDTVRRLPLQNVTTAEYLEEPAMDEKLAAKNHRLTDRVRKQFGEHPEFFSLLEEAERIQAMYQINGIQRCTQLLVIGQK